MSVNTESRIWYVAYGSNKAAERFHTYLHGGTPKGSRRTYVGARNPALPARVVSVSLPHRLFFAGASPVWGGGVAFIDPRPDPVHATPAVAWLITIEQLSDLVAQENGGEAPGPPMSRMPGPGERQFVVKGRYDLLVGLDAIDGVQAVTLTSSNPPESSQPSRAYLALVEQTANPPWVDLPNSADGR
ncbi:MAG: histone deacetylase [Microthrixaceae bacterium]